MNKDKQNKKDRGGQPANQTDNRNKNAPNNAN